MDLSLKDAARLLGKSPRQLRYAIRQGKLPARKVGGQWLLSREGLPLSEGQARAQAAKRQQVVEVVEQTLGLDLKDGAEPRGRPHYSVRQLKAFREAEHLYREAREKAGSEHTATEALHQALVHLCRGCHSYHAGEKAEHYRKGRETAALAVVELLLCTEADGSTELATAVEQRLLPRIGGLLRRLERRKRR